MDFDTLDKQMRRFEQSLDRAMLEGIYVVARLDGHGFTRLTKKDAAQGGGGPLTMHRRGCRVFPVVRRMSYCLSEVSTTMTFPFGRSEVLACTTVTSNGKVSIPLPRKLHLIPVGLCTWKWSCLLVRTIPD